MKVTASQRQPLLDLALAGLSAAALIVDTVASSMDRSQLPNLSDEDFVGIREELTNLARAAANLRAQLFELNAELPFAALQPLDSVIPW